MDREQELMGTLAELSGILTGVQTLIQSANDDLSNIKSMETRARIDGNLYAAGLLMDTAELLIECAAESTENV